MRIMLFIGQLARGGAERQFALLAGELVKKGHEVCFVTLTDNGDSPEYLQLLDGAERRLLFKRRYPGPLRFVQFSRGWRPFRRLIMEFKPDVVYSALEWTNWIAARAVASISRPPAFIAGMRTGTWELGGVPWRRRYPNTCLARHASRVPIDGLIANSRPGLETAHRIGFQASINRVVFNGIDTNRFKPDDKTRAAFRDQVGIAESTMLIGTVGRLDPQKDHQNLFTAFSSVREKHSTASLLCVGSGPHDYARSLRNVASELGISDAVHWLEHCTDMASVYSSLDCFVQSSLTEGFPNVLGEAMSCGVPCVATDVGESASLLGPEGLVVPHSDSDRLAEAILDSLAEPSRFSSAARARVKEHFSVNAMVEQTVFVFEEVLRGVHQ